MRVGRWLATLLRHAGLLLEAREGRLLRRLGARRRGHARSLSRGLAHAVLARARPFRWNDRVGLVHGVGKRWRGITDLAVLHGGHLLGIGELGVELGPIGHEGGGIHHGSGDGCGVGEVREAVVAIVVCDSGFVDPGAHDCRV